MNHVQSPTVKFGYGIFQNKMDVT